MAKSHRFNSDAEWLKFLDEQSRKHEEFCQKQLSRLLSPDSEEGDQNSTKKDVGAVRVLHAAGKRKPSLDEIEAPPIFPFPKTRI